MTSPVQIAQSFEQYAEHFKRFNPGDPTSTFGSYDLNLATLLPSNRKARILDFGCGMGHFLLYLKHSGYTNVEGIDVSRTQIEHCHSIGLANAFLTEDSLSYLTSRPNGYDLIAALDVFEHLPKDRVIPALKAARSALKPGGRFIMKVPNAAAAVGPWTRYMDFTHETSYCDRSAYQIFQFAGFQDIHVMPNRTYYNHKFRGKLFEMLRWGLYVGVKCVYTLQAPGTAIPEVLTLDLIAVGDNRL